MTKLLILILLLIATLLGACGGNEETRSAPAPAVIERKDAESVLAKYPTTVPLTVVVPSVGATPTAMPTTTPLSAVQSPPNVARRTEAALGKYPTTVPVPSATQEPRTPLATSPTVTPTLDPTATPVPSTPTPTLTPLPTPIPSTPTPTLTPLPTPIPSTPTPTLTPLPTSTVTPKPTSTATPIPLEIKQHMVDVVNTARRDVGLEPLLLGTNELAQLHADSMLEHCFLSSWDLDGNKHYMRYSFAGGYQVTRPVLRGTEYCLGSNAGFAKLDDIKAIATDAVERWLEHPDSDTDVLSPHFKKLHIGLAWNMYNFRIYAFYETNYVRFTDRPTISVDGELSFAGRLNGIEITDKKDLSVKIFHDRTPGSLTAGQLIRAQCADIGRQVASLRPPLPSGFYYKDPGFTKWVNECPSSPFEVSPDASVPRTVAQMQKIQQELTVKHSRGISVSVNWVTASEWKVSEDEFEVKADIGYILRKQGYGVYTVRISSAGTPVAYYSIHHSP